MMGRRLISIFGAVGVSAVFLFVLLRFASPAAAAGVIVVNPGESIQAAIDGAAAGDTILIMAGTYTESLTLNKPVSLTGVSSATTIIQAEPNDRVITVTGATITKGVVISGLALTGGFTYPSGDGAGVLLLDYAHPSFVEVMFYDNYARSGGGLWDVERAATLYFTRTSFVENYASGNSGGMRIGTGKIFGGQFIWNACSGNGVPFDCSGGAIDGITVTVSGATFLSNTASDGGAIYGLGITITDSYFGANNCSLWDYCTGGAIRGAFLTISNSIFNSNEASGVGGAVFSGGTADIMNSVFEENSCGKIGCWGGGLYVSSFGRISGTTFLNNDSGGSGGGIFAWRNLVVSDSIMMGNLADEGGGVYIGGILNGPKKIINSFIEDNHCVAAGCEGGGVWVSGTIAITGSTFVSNTADWAGGGMWAENDAYIYDSVFTANSSDTGGGAFVDGAAWVDDSLFESNMGGGLLAFEALRTTDSVYMANQNTTMSIGYGGGLSTSNLYMTGTQVLSNTAGVLGGGAYIDVAGVVVDSNFGGNRCESSFICSGGGIYVNYQNSGALVISGSVFMNNIAKNYGGGVLGNGPTIVQGSIFSGNSCLAADCRGGGLANLGQLTVTQSVFAGNYSGGIGGAMYVGQPFMMEGGGTMKTAVLVNNLFADNTAGSNGAGLFFDGGSVALIHNTIAASAIMTGQAVYVLGGTAVMTNTVINHYGVGVENAGGVVSEDYNLYFGNGVNLSGTVGSGGASIDGDPDFVDPAAGDYHIGQNSGGLDNGLDLGILVDLDGNPRPIGVGPDRGAYEFVEQPIIGLAVESDSPTMLGSSTQLTATITAGTNVTYSWNFGDGSGGVGQVVSHTYGMAGSYTVTVTATNSVGSMMVTAVVVVLEPEPIEWVVYMPVVIRP